MNKGTKISYRVILGDGEIIGSPINNTEKWTGMIGMLLRGVIETTFSAFLSVNFILIYLKIGC